MYKVNYMNNLEILNQILALVGSDDQNSDYKTILDMINQATGDGTIDDLSPEDQKSLLVSIINAINDGDLDVDVPDVDLSECLAGLTGSEVEPEAKIKKLESDLANANKKLNVAKSLLRQLDTKVSKYEALNLDGMVDTLARYESMGTPDELKSKLESLSDKKLVTKPKTEACSTDADNKTSEEGNLEKSQMDLLKQYQELGTIDEIKALMSKTEALLLDHAEAKDKLESATQDLSKYESIGTPNEIITALSEYASIRTKTESERIATALGIDVNKVKRTIEKMESVADAEALLTDLLGKSESKEIESTTMTDETARVITTKPKTESDTLDNLREFCNKI